MKQKQNYVTYFLWKKVILHDDNRIFNEDANLDVAMDSEFNSKIQVTK